MAGEIFRGPLVGQRQQKHQVLGGTFPNVLLATLSLALPVGAQWIDSAPQDRKEVRADLFPNTTLFLRADVTDRLIGVEFGTHPGIKKLPSVYQPPNLLLSTLVPVVTPANPFTPPSLPGTPRRASVKVDLPPNLLFTTLVPTEGFVFGADFRTNIGAPRFLPQAIPPNLLLGTLKPQAGAPPIRPILFQAPQQKGAQFFDIPPNYLNRQVVLPPTFPGANWPLVEPKAAVVAEQYRNQRVLTLVILPPFPSSVPPTTPRQLDNNDLLGWVPNLQASSFRPPVVSLPFSSPGFILAPRRSFVPVSWSYRNLLLYIDAAGIYTEGRIARWELPVKPAAARVRTEWAFTSLFPRGDTVASATTSCQLYSGNVDDSAGILSGTTTYRGQYVRRTLVGGTAGQTYLISCVARSAANRRATLISYLTVL